MNDEEQMLQWFKEYSKRKEEGTLYVKDDFLGPAIITLYCQNQRKRDYSGIYANFKERYILNENDVENVKNKDERKGLGEVYDYISSDQTTTFNNIFVLLNIHSLLYSKVPFPEFGGRFRTAEAVISNSDIKTEEPQNISFAVSCLNPEYIRLDTLAKEIVSNHAIFKIVDYIKDCLKLKARLIEIHPFADGNGRTCRAFLNIMLKKIDLPPVYIEENEKREYIAAMDQAIRENNFDPLNKFYYFKICNSIIDFDINYRTEVTPKM